MTSPLRAGQGARGRVGGTLGLVLSLIVGCGGAGGAGSAAISNQPLAGRVGGQPFTLGTAQTNASLSTATQFWVDMYASTFATCVAFGAPTNADELIAMLPNAPGTYSLSLNLNATFYVASTSSNLVATSGTIVIDTVTATTITGGAHITYNADNTLDGQFQVAICP